MLLKELEVKTKSQTWSFFKNSIIARDKKQLPGPIKFYMDKFNIEDKEKALNNLQKLEKASYSKSMLNELSLENALDLIQYIAYAAGTTVTLEQWSKMNKASQAEKQKSLEQLANFLQTGDNLTNTKNFLAAWIAVVKNYKEQAELRRKIQQAPK